MLNLNIEKFKSNLALHHQLYPDLPLQDVMLESLLERSITDFVEHNVGSHSIGFDFVIKGNKVSVKSGRFVSKDNRLKFSSHRTTAQKTIEEKIEFVNDTHYDYQYIFAKVDDWKKTKQYKLFVFNKQQLDIDGIKFIESDTGWTGENDKMIVKIMKSLSDQVWFNIDLNNIKPLETIEFGVPQYDLEWLSNQH